MSFLPELVFFNAEIGKILILETLSKVVFSIERFHPSEGYVWQSLRRESLSVVTGRLVTPFVRKVLETGLCLSCPKLTFFDVIRASSSIAKTINNFFSVISDSTGLSTGGGPSQTDYISLRGKTGESFTTTAKCISCVGFFLQFFTETYKIRSFQSPFEESTDIFNFCLCTRFGKTKLEILF